MYLAGLDSKGLPFERQSRYLPSEDCQNLENQRVETPKVSFEVMRCTIVRFNTSVAKNELERRKFTLN